MRGDRWPAVSLPECGQGDIDVLLRDENGDAITDRVLMLQQIQYACDRDGQGNPKPAAERWTCADDETGSIDNYTVFLPPRNWADSGRFTTVNGRVAAPLALEATAGVPERWRLIHGGFSASIRVQVFPAQADTDLAALETTASEDQPEAISRNCQIHSDPVAMFEIAADGLTRTQVQEATARNLHPGYRSDVLMSFPAAGGYRVVYQGLDPAQGIEGSRPEPRLLFSVNVKEGPEPVVPARQANTDLMVAAVEAASDNDVTMEMRDGIVASLRDGLKLPMFAPHATLAEAELDNVQHIRFALGGAVQPDHPDWPAALGLGIGRITTEPGTTTPPAYIDLRFTERAQDIVNLYLNDVDEWRLTSRAGAHPFHIHINPFEVQAVMKTVNRNGTIETIDLTQVENYLDAAGVRQESQYFGMKGVFKDTIIVEPEAEIILRSHYERYVGTYVLHCHILYHEDLGMMRLVRINDPLPPNVPLEIATGHGH